MSDTYSNLPTEPSLLVRPNPFRTEGPKGYLLRLAESNWMTLEAMASQGIAYNYQVLQKQQLLPLALLDPELHGHVRTISESLQLHKRAWNHRFCRFCPICLSEDAHWRTGWELLFHDACPTHDVWLIDQCASCGNTVSWRRDSLIRCQCGADLRMEQPSPCPENIKKLSSILLSKLEGSADSYPPALSKTNLEQSQRIIRYLGIYMHPDSGRNPLKLHSSGLLSNSWGLTTLASEIIMNWPDGLYAALDKIQAAAPTNDKRRLGSVFGQAYHYLYKALSDAAFKPVRDSFETWMAASWRGALAKRNKRLAESVLKNAEWVPASLVRETLGISYQRLQWLIKEESLDTTIDTSRAGRKFIMLRKDQIQGLKDRLDGYVDMTKAGELLGFCKKRMRQLLRMLFPYARKSSFSNSAKWQVPRHEVEFLLDVGGDLKMVSIPDEGCVSLGHVLRYWNWAVEDVHGLIDSVRSGSLRPNSKLAEGTGIARWIFNVNQLKALHTQRSQGYGDWISIKQMTKQLNIHNDVAYSLVRNYFSNGESTHIPRKGYQIKSTEIERFKKEFIFGTEISQSLGVSPRKVLSILADRHIKPVSGPGIDDVRQYIFRRNEELYLELDMIKSKSDFRLT